MNIHPYIQSKSVNRIVLKDNIETISHFDSFLLCIRTVWSFHFADTLFIAVKLSFYFLFGFYIHSYHIQESSYLITIDFFREINKNMNFLHAHFPFLFSPIETFLKWYYREDKRFFVKTNQRKKSTQIMNICKFF